MTTGKRPWPKSLRVAGVFIQVVLIVVALILKYQAETGYSLVKNNSTLDASSWRSPLTKQRWIDEPLDEVSVWWDETKHFQLDDLGIQESESLLPSSGHTVQVNGKTFTVAMFHRLKCFTLIQTAIAEKMKSASGPDQRVDGIANDCVRYLWNAILCTGNSQFENVWHPSNMTGLAVVPGAYRCRDWRSLYTAKDS